MASGRSAALHAFGDAVADLLVDVAPVFERTLQHGLGHAFLEVPDDVGHKPVALLIVHYLTHQGAGLTEVVVVFAQSVGGADELAAGRPDRCLGIALAVSLRATLRVRCVYGVGHVLDPHRPVFTVAVYRCLWPIDRDLLVVDPQAGTVGIGVGEEAAEQHFVRADTDPRHEVVRFERRLLDLGVEVGWVAVQGQSADLVQRVVTVRPHLGQVEGVEPVGLGLFEGHDLNLQRPAGVITALDRLEQVAPMVVGVNAGDPVGLLLGEEVDALVGLEVVLHPEALALCIDPHVGVARVAVHVPPSLRDPAVTHQPRDLMGRLGRQGPEIPLHVVVAQVVVRPALLGADEVLELHGVTDEEHRSVVPHHVVVALAGVELQREATWVTPGVRAAALAGHRGEPDQRVRLRFRLEHRGLGVGADILGHLEVTEGPGTLRVGLALRNPFPVEVGHLLDEVVVLQQDGPIGPHGERVLVAGYGDPGIGCCGFAVVVFHGNTSFVW